MVAEDAGRWQRKKSETEAQGPLVKGRRRSEGEVREGNRDVE